MAFFYTPNTIEVPIINQIVSADISLQKAIAYLAALEINCLLVEEAGQLQGWLTARDVVKLATQGRAGDDCALRMVMTQPPYVLDPEEARDLSLVLHYLQKYRVDQLPVVANNGELLGLVTSQGIMPLCGRQLDYLTQLELHTDQFINAQVAAQIDQNYLFQEITDSISGLIYIYDLEEQRNIYSNKYITSALGYTPLEIQEMGQNLFSQIIHPEDLPQLLARAKMQETVTINDDRLCITEYRIRHADGSWRWWYSHDRAFRYHPDGRAKQIVGFAQDITDRKHIELELQSSQHLLQAITETIPGLVYIYDLQAHQNIYINSLAPEILGYTKAQIDELGSNLLGQVIHPEDLAIITPLVMEQLAQGTIAKSEYRLRNAQGEWRWALEHTTVFQASAEGVPQQILGIVIDIHDRKVAEAALQNVNIELENRVTERSQELWHTSINLAHEINQKIEIEAALRQSEELFRSIFEQAAAGMNTAMIIDGTIVRVNQKLCQMLGYTETELLTMTWMEFTAPKFMLGALEYTAKRHRGETGCDNFEKQLICKDGSLLWVNVTVSLWKDPLTNISYDLAITQDISDRKAAEAQIQANLQEKELLLKEIHHRVKNNLQVISSLLTLQAQSVADPTILAMFQDSQTRIYAIALIHDQLYKTTQFDQINFAEYIKNLVSHLHQLHSYSLDSIQIQTNIADLLLNVETAIPCGLIINELVINALKYAFPESIKSIDKQIIIELQQLSDQQLSLSIKDNGIGILKDYYKLKTTDTLGLRLVKILTQQLEGEITLTCNSGTEFAIIFKELKYSQRIHA